MGEDIGGGGALCFHPPLAPPIKGGGFQEDAIHPYSEERDILA
jgi:hypothetical protein